MLFSLRKCNNLSGSSSQPLTFSLIFLLKNVKLENGYSSFLIFVSSTDSTAVLLLAKAELFAFNSNLDELQRYSSITFFFFFLPLLVVNKIISSKEVISVLSLFESNIKSKGPDSIPHGDLQINFNLSLMINYSAGTAGGRPFPPSTIVL